MMDEIMQALGVFIMIMFLLIAGFFLLLGVWVELQK